MADAKRRVTLRRVWPYWNWAIWESGPLPTEVVAEGLTLRRKAAIREAREALPRFEKWDSLYRIMAETEHDPGRGDG